VANDPNDSYAYLSSLSAHPKRAGDTSNFNPAFATPLATAIRQARAAGLNVGLESGFREPTQTGSAYDAGGNSSHTYGLAADISGLGGANSPAAQQWKAIAEANGLHNPYGIGDKAEFNHWQLPEQPLEKTPQLLAALQQAKASGNMQNVWSTYSSGGGPSRPASGAIADNRQIFFNALTQKAGLTPNQALGALWSLGGESGGALNTGAYNPKDPGGAFGAGQWLGTRRAGLEAFAQARGTAPTDPQTQADYMVAELKGGVKGVEYQPGALDALKGSQTAADATKAFTGLYERPKIDNSVQRIAAGGQVGSLDAKGNLVLGTSGAAPAPVGTTLTSTPAPAGGAPLPGTLPGFGDKEASDNFLQGAKAFEGLAGDGGQQQMQAPPPMPAPPAANVTPFRGMERQIYGNTLNSIMPQTPMGPQAMEGMMTPPQWSSKPPGQNPWANVGAQQPGLSLNSLNQWAMLSDPNMQQYYSGGLGGLV
jgi:hypothetical protein